MSIFGDILSKIFSHATPGTAAASTAGTDPTPSAQPASASPVAPAGSTPLAAVDVAKVLDELRSKSKERDIDWRRSIVDLMKLLSLDSSLSARRELAKELSYQGDTKDTGSMNVWLHKQVMAKLAANGGKVPDDLKH